MRVERRVGNRSVDGGWKRRERKREDTEVLLREDGRVEDCDLSHDLNGLSRRGELERGLDL